MYFIVFKLAALLLLSKAVDKGWLRFYVAGPLYAIAEPLYTLGAKALAEASVNGTTSVDLHMIAGILPHTLLVAAVATAAFWLVERYSETLAGWFVISIVAIIVLVVFL